MSKSLLKLLDNSIFPACVMILAKLLGVISIIWLLEMPYSVRDYFSNVYSLRVVVHEENLMVLNSYSDLVMYLVLAIFFSVSIIRAIFLHGSHIKPSMVMKLANNNLLGLIQSSYEIYHSAIVWLLFMWVSNVLLVVNVLSGNTYVWIGIISTLISILLTTVLLQDVYKEIENIKQKPGKYLLG
jgi:hypothetical protein